MRAASIEIPLRPSPRLQRVLWMLRTMVLAYLVELVLTGHCVVAAVAGLAAALAMWPGTTRHEGSQVLRLDGGVFSICDARGETPMVLRPASRRIGMHLLLLFNSPAGTRRVLLGPDNVPASELAALLRCLPTGADAMTALHCQPLIARESHPIP